MPKKILQHEESIFICDVCGNKMDYDTYQLSCGYGSWTADLENFYYCDEECLLAGVNKLYNDEKDAQKLLGEE